MGAGAVDARTRSSRRELRLFLREWRYVKPFLGASALRRLGIPAGPELGAVLRRLRAARLDGVTQSREDEMELLGTEGLADQREESIAVFITGKMPRRYGDGGMRAASFLSSQAVTATGSSRRGRSASEQGGSERRNDAP